MKTRPSPMFPRLRLLMMLFMLFSMASSFGLTASAAPSTTDQSGAGAFQSAELCHELDTDDNMSLSPNELRAFKGDLNGDGKTNDADIDLLSGFCSTLPSLNLGGMITICHATGSESKPYEIITVAAAAVVAGHLGLDHQNGEDIIPQFVYGGESFGPQGDPSWIGNNCQPPTQPDTYTLTIVKYFCTVDDETVEVPGPTIGTPGTGCVVATDQEFTLSLEGTTFTTAQLLAGVELLPGTYNLYEGETLLGPITVVDTDLVVNVLNYVPDQDQNDGYITVLKRFCEADNSDNTNSNCNGRVAPDVDVTFNVYDSEDTLLGTIVVTDFNEGNGSQGTAQSTMSLVVGETYTVCEVAPDGWDAVPRPGAQGGANQTGQDDCIIVELVPGNNVLQFNNFPMEQPEEGVAKVVKYFCTDPGITVPVVGDAESGFDGCEPATADQLTGVNFWVYPFGVAANAIDIDDTALLTTGVTLPVGTHTLVEEFNGVIHELADLTIVAGQTTTIMVYNPAAPEEITVNIYKLVCSEISDAQEDGCVESNKLDGTKIDFTVSYTIGEDETTVDTSLTIDGSEGSAVLNLPLADSYTVCEDTPDGVEEVLLGIIGVDTAESNADGCITFSGEGLADGALVELIFWNDLEDETPVTPTPTPVTPEQPKPTPPAVKVLPSTGSGSEDGQSAAPWMLVASAALLAAGTASVLRKDRHAA